MRFAGRPKVCLYPQVNLHHPALEPAPATFLRDDARQTLGIPNLGGGLNYWLPGRRRRDLGLKLEFRSYARAGKENVKYQEVRMGVTLWQ